MTAQLETAIDLIIAEFGPQAGPKNLEHKLLEIFPECASEWRQFREEVREASQRGAATVPEMVFARGTAF
jgi:hypothetical protein